jgi:hypothetical protein
VLDYRDGRDKPGHDQLETGTIFAPVTEKQRYFWEKT